MEKEKTSVSEEVERKITSYVHKNYKEYDGKKLYINQYGNCFAISHHPDSSPLILGIGIIQ